MRAPNCATGPHGVLANIRLYRTGGTLAESGRRARFWRQLWRTGCRPGALLSLLGPAPVEAGHGALDAVPILVGGVADGTGVFLANTPSLSGPGDGASAVVREKRFGIHDGLPDALEYLSRQPARVNSL